MRSEHRQLDDKWLDGALERYGDVEPRAGLELRILAGLRERQTKPARSGAWWLATLLGVGSALTAGLVFFAWLAPPPRAPLARVAGSPVPAKTSGNGNIGVRAHPHNIQRRAGGPPFTGPREDAPGAQSTPRRDQFPSPSPLSEQEEMLARYVREHYQEAVLVARAQVELLKRDQAEKVRSDEQRFGKTYEKER